MSQLSFTNI